MATEKPFQPLLVCYDKAAHEIAQQQAEDKLTLLDEASVWIHNQLDLNDAKINMKRLHLNMVEYFKDAVLSRYKDVNQLGLSASKLIEAKEIPVGELVAIQEEYEQSYLDSDITFTDNTPRIEVNKESFEMWTRNEEQNKMVIYGNQFIKSVNDLTNSLGVQVYPAQILEATSGFIQYNRAENKYTLDRARIFS